MISIYQRGFNVIFPLYYYGASSVQYTSNFLSQTWQRRVFLQFSVSKHGREKGGDVRLLATLIAYLYCGQVSLPFCGRQKDGDGEFQHLISAATMFSYCFFLSLQIAVIFSYTRALHWIIGALSHANAILKLRYTSVFIFATFFCND